MYSKVANYNKNNFMNKRSIPKLFLSKTTKSKKTSKAKKKALTYRQQAKKFLTDFS